MDVPRTWCAGRGIGAGGWAGPSAEHRRNARGERIPILLRTDKMNMRFHATRRHDAALRGDSFRTGPDLHSFRHVRHQIGIPGFANADDAPIFNPDIRLDDTPMVENDCVRDDRIERAACAARPWRLAHAIPQYFPTAKHRLISIRRKIIFNFDQQLGISQPDSVTHRGSKEIRILFA